MKYKMRDTICEPRTACRNDFLSDSKSDKGRLGTLFAAGATAVIAGLLLPLSTHILDVFLIFSISLTAAVLIITVSAREASQVQSFPLLIVLLTTLRMALSSASAKLILSQGDAGTIISFLGHLIVRDNCVPAILIFSTLTVIIFGTICKAVKGISRTSTEFATDIVTLKEINIDSDLNCGLINNEQALTLREKIAHEAGFFIAMGGAARFILCGAVIEFVIILINIVGGTAAGVTAPTTAGISAGSPLSEELQNGALRMYTTSAVGAGMIMQISSLITAAASRYLVRKSSIAADANVPFAEHGAQRIEVAAGIAKRKAVRSVCPTEASAPGAVEQQDNCTMNETGQIESQYAEAEAAAIMTPAASADIAAYEAAIVEDANWFDEQTADESERSDSDLRLNTTTKGSERPAEANCTIDNSEQYISRQICGDDGCYDAIADMIADKSVDSGKTILMAAENVRELPVTIPVNIAVRLAQMKQRCLLVDLDLERGAIAKVFDVDEIAAGSNVEAKAIATCISNLWVWPAGNFYRTDSSDVMDLKDAIVALESRYDRLIIYAPNIGLRADWEQIAGCVQAVMLFAPQETESPSCDASRNANCQERAFGDAGDEGGFENSSLTDFGKLLESYGCEILKPAEVLVEVA